MAPSTSAESRTLRVSGPTWSRDHDRDSTPRREARPYVGLIPTVPQTDAGMRIEPPVSVPMATRHMPAATAAPDPPLDPPGMCSRPHGLRVVGVMPPKANSCVSVFPTRIMPAAARAAIAALSVAATLPASAAELP